VEGEEGWQVEADLDDAAGNVEINDDTFVIRGNGNRVLDAVQLDPDNGTGRRYNGATLED
jgi:hypothetical protein